VELAGAVSGVPARRVCGGAVLAATVVGYLIATPPVPDLAAQVARADVVRRVGETVWWSGWFGGLHVPSYSAVSPAVMASVGVRATGAAALVLSALVMTRLLRNAPRPRCAAVCFVITDAANLLDGRITFALSLAFGVCCLGLLTTSRPTPTLASAAAGFLAILTCLTSPLGGLFLFLAVTTIAVTDSGRRRSAVTLGALLVGTVALTAVLFPGLGRMPSPLPNFLPAAACTATIAMTCRAAWLRVGAAGYLALQALLLVVPTPVGVNVTRLAWVFALPLIVGYARLPRWSLVGLSAGAVLLPGVDLTTQLATTTDPSTSPIYYRPLVRALDRQTAANPARRGQRVEVLDTRGHWASVYVARRYSLARGWERQADAALNPLFYIPGRLDPAAYRAWLLSLAVGWVAVPRAKLDYAAVEEARLVADHPRYLRTVWTSRDWTLYRVVAAPPLLEQARVLTADDRGVTFAARNSTMHAAIRWSPYLVVTTPAGRRAGCVVPSGGWITVHLPQPGTYRLTADFDGVLGHGRRCRST
jgi:hypothetical protein